MSEDIESKEDRRAKYRRKHQPKPRNPFARALYEDNLFRQKIKGVDKKDRLRPQDLKRLLVEDKDNDSTE